MASFRYLCALVIAAGVALGAGSVALAQGKLEIVGGDSYDWGTVTPGKLKAVIELKNIGTAELKIDSVAPTCACTIAPLDKNRLNPGEIARMSVTMDASNRNGIMERSIIIRSNDASNPVRTLKLRATIKREITLVPSEYLVVLDAKAGVESLASAVGIVNSGTVPVTIYPPDSVKGNVKVRFEMTEPKELKPGEVLQIIARITPLEPNQLYGSAQLRTTNARMPVVEVKFTGTFLPAHDGGHHN